MLTSSNILNFIKAHRSDLVLLKVKRIGLFGSYIRNEQKENSDIDLLVEYERGGKSFDGFMKLIDILENGLGKNVELLTQESVSKFIRPHIDKEIKYVEIIS